MSLYGKRPARTRIALESKKLGADIRRLHSAGARCSVERSGACLGELIVWFPGKHYIKVDAINLPDIIEYTDNKPRF